MRPLPWLLRAVNVLLLLSGAYLMTRGRAADVTTPACAALTIFALQGALVFAGKPADARRRRNAELGAAALDLVFLVWCVHWIGSWRAGLETAALAPAVLIALDLGPWAGAAAGALPVIAAAGLGAAAGRALGPFDALSALLGALPPVTVGLALPAARAETSRSALLTLSRLRAAQVGEYLSFAMFQLRDYAVTISSVTEAMLLSAPKEDAKSADRLERLRKTVHELDGKLARLLGDKSTLTSYRATQAAVDLATLTHEAIEEARLAFAPEGVAVDVRVEAVIAPTRADRKAIELSLLAVLQNALEACLRRGGGRVSVTLRGGEGRADIEIIDDGGGISEEALACAFEPIISARAGGHGMGLGLSTARRFLERIGGDVRVKSRDGRTAVLLQIPLDQQLPRIRNEESTWAGRRAGA